MTLTKRQREHLEKRLREERERVLRALGQYDAELGDEVQEAAGDVSKFPTHLADEGTDTFDRELDAQEASRLTGELEEIDAALERFYQAPDSFGRDERTGADIPFERLGRDPVGPHAHGSETMTPPQKHPTDDAVVGAEGSSTTRFGAQPCRRPNPATFKVRRPS